MWERMSKSEVMTNIMTMTLFANLLNYNTKLMSLVNEYLGVLIMKFCNTDALNASQKMEKYQHS